MMIARIASTWYDNEPTVQQSTNDAYNENQQGSHLRILHAIMFLHLLRILLKLSGVVFEILGFSLNVLKTTNIL